MRARDDVAADLASRQFRNLPPRHRLQISDRRQRKGFRLGELPNRIPCPSGMGGADRRREAGFGAQRIAAGDEGEVVGAAAQFVDEVGDQIVEPAVLADQADERLARDGFFRGEDGGFDAQHPFPPARGRRQVEKLNVEGLVALSSSAAGGGAHRPYSRNAGRPENSRAAPSATRRSNSRRAARSVIGAWRAASAGETQSWASSRSTIFAAGLARSFGATAMRVSARRAEIGGEVEGGGGGERDRARGGVWPGRVAGPRPPPSPVRPQAGIQDFRGDQRHGPRPAQPDGEDDVERPEREDFGFGGRGVREGGERQAAAALAAAETGSPSPARLQAFCEAVRVRRARSRRAAAAAIRPGVEAGRPAGADRARATGASPAGPGGRRRRSAGRAARLRRR